MEASAIVQVKSQVAGQLERVAFTEGQNVSKGDLLFVIDQRPFQEALRQAEAAVGARPGADQPGGSTVARDTAQANSPKRMRPGTRSFRKRAWFRNRNTTSRRLTRTSAREAARATQASIESARARSEADQAAVATAKLNLSYCEIHAPISGRTGNLLVHAGNLVKANDVPLVVIHQVAPIFVNFSVPEQHLASIRRLHSRNGS